ncbi:MULTISPECIES: ATP-binding protein [Pseudoalteromonas]|uniref:histidine kinase n=1 Tax=Pseudoalteromonas rubra TaxID=43658 RepID=A0A5S3US11_9GAMM|nr:MULTISPECIES: ATP-binding protein [Pseudoalteromonas]MCG7559996.1 ATP-binding protein [Pseudoalteromonas sp. McH1-42]QPB86078.1 GHKL domain-containing protein [Pseudoalteromonas rubra]
MSQGDNEYYKAYRREKQARDELETLLEDKTRSLYLANQELEANLTQLKRQHAAILQSEKMATLGVMSAGVAHEINNPLAYVNSNVATLGQVAKGVAELINTSQQFSDNAIDQEAFKEAFKNLEAQYQLGFFAEDAEDLIEDCQDGCRRIATIVASLLDFARPKNNEFVMADMTEAIDSALGLLANQLKHIELVVEKADIPLSYCNLAALNQVIINLLMNAKYACEQGKALGNCPTPQIKLIVSQLQDHILIEMIDNGTGIESDILPHIFEPFFTTKPVGQGTGMGLAVVYGIISEHKGTINIESKRNEGAKVSLTLPVIIAS